MEDKKAQHPLGTSKEVNRPPPEINDSPPNRQINDKPQGGSPPTESGSVCSKSNENDKFVYEPLDATKEAREYIQKPLATKFMALLSTTFSQNSIFFEKIRGSIFEFFHDASALIVPFAASFLWFILECCSAFKIGWTIAQILSNLGFAPYSFWSWLVILTICGLMVIRKLRCFMTLLRLLEWIINQITDIIDDL